MSALEQAKAAAKAAAEAADRAADARRTAEAQLRRHGEAKAVGARG
ncbi:hypothetical protein ACN6AT_37770 (plasmid) [Streptomyces sp. JL4002]